MKYKVILIFLMSCIIIVSVALFTYVFLSKDLTKIEENKTELNQSFQSKEKKDEANINNAQIEENIANEETNITLKNEQKEEPKIQEKTHIEEQNSEKEMDKQDGEQMALKLVKEEWGEDDSVYYTIDRHIGNIYDVSVRSKANTQSLMEYEIDIENKTVKMK